MFLTKEQLAELTGRKRVSCQRKWLKDHGWRFEENAIGRIIVLSAYVESMMGCGQPQQTESYRPNFDGIRKRA